MHRRHAVLAVLAIVLASLFVSAGTAVAHEGQIVSATCSTATGSFTDFAKGDHPIAFAVSINGGSSTAVAGVESPPNFVGSGTATADISTLTATLDGTTGTVAVYAFWPGGTTATVKYTVTCGTPATTTTTKAPATTTTTKAPATTTTTKAPATTTTTKAPATTTTTKAPATTTTTKAPATTTTTAPPTTSTTRPPTTPTTPTPGPEATTQVVTVVPVMPPAVAIQAPPATAG